jgi:hypothetical protein
VVDGQLYVIGGRSLAPDGGIVEVSGAIPGVEVYAPGKDVGPMARATLCAKSRLE